MKAMEVKECSRTKVKNGSSQNFALKVKILQYLPQTSFESNLKKNVNEIIIESKKHSTKSSDLQFKEILLTKQKTRRRMDWKNQLEKNPIKKVEKTVEKSSNFRM